MKIYSSQFYQGIVPQKLLDMAYMKEHDDFMESKLEIIYRFLYKNIKLEISFFKKTSSIHYIQMENLGNGDTLDDIVLIDDAEIFDKKEQWIRNKLGKKSKKIKLYFDDKSSLYSMTMNNSI